jgi:hypothetical protein
MDPASWNQVFPSPANASGARSEFAEARQMDAILKALGHGERFLVCSHARPDGDAVGSMLAMGMLIKQMGKRADLVSADRIPNIYRGLPGAQEIHSALRVHGPYDAAILLECDGLARTRLHGLGNFPILNIDHHASGRAFGQLNWIDCRAASVGELVYRLVKAAGVTVTPEMATCLYVTVLTDTGGFCYGSTQASTFELARELVLAGADPIRIAQDVYFFNRYLEAAAAGRGTEQPEARRTAGLAVGHPPGHGAHLRRRGRLRRNCEFCGRHLRRGGRGVFARTARAAHPSKSAQQGPGQRRRHCGTDGRRRARKRGRLHAGRAVAAGHRGDSGPVAPRRGLFRRGTGLTWALRFNGNLLALSQLKRWSVFLKRRSSKATRSRGFILNITPRFTLRRVRVICENLVYDFRDRF